MRSFVRPVLLLPLALGLGACQRSPTVPPQTTAAADAASPTAAPGLQADALPMQWRCGEELVRAAADPARERLALSVRGTRLDMQRTEAGAASGARYTDALGNVFLQSQPDQATLTLAGLGETLKCVRHDSGMTG
ncbi:MAG: MliC family protein [Xanthomonas sp.]